MASFHHQIKSGKKGTAAQHSDYISRQGKHDRREDLVATGYGNMPTWAKSDPRRLWEGSDKHERKNAAGYREHEIAIPLELTKDQQLEVVDQHVIDIAKDKPYQYAVHATKSSLEGIPNIHLHLMISDRSPDGIERSPEQMFKRYNPKHPEKGGRRKDSGGRSPMVLRDEVIALKKRTEEVQNAALAKYGHDVRVDHRSLKQQGIERKPEKHLGQARIRKMSVQDKAAYVEARYDHLS